MGRGESRTSNEKSKEQEKKREERRKNATKGKELRMKSSMDASKKGTREQTKETTAQAKPMFQSRPFEVQSPMEDRSQQQDMKSAIQRADRYGHHLNGSVGEDKARSTETEQGRGKKKGQVGIDLGVEKGVVQRASNGEEDSSPLSEHSDSEFKDLETSESGKKNNSALARNQRAHERAVKRAASQAELGSRVPHVSRTGKTARVSKGGRGGKQAMVSTNKQDHPGTKPVGVAYPPMIGGTGKSGMENLAANYTRGAEEPRPLTPQTERATTQFDITTQVAEERRDPGAAKMARSATRKVGAGEIPVEQFPNAFGMSKPRGSHHLERAREGKERYTKLEEGVLEDMSTSSESGGESKKARKEE